ncbi:hypothetical protein D9M70_491640 [compost metagenome]
MPVMSRAATIALLMDSSVASTVAWNSGSIRPLGNCTEFTGFSASISLTAPVVENDTMMSPDWLPANEPRRASPMDARRATRLSWVGVRGASVPTTMMIEPWSLLGLPPSPEFWQRGVLSLGARSGR